MNYCVQMQKLYNLYKKDYCLIGHTVLITERMQLTIEKW